MASFEMSDRQTATEVIGEAAWRVNWTPDLQHSERARYDALQALTHVYAFSTAVAMETLRRVDPEAAERVAAYISSDHDWVLVAENAWTWHERLSDGDPIDPDGQVFAELAGAAVERQEDNR